MSRICARNDTFNDSPLSPPTSFIRNPLLDDISEFEENLIDDFAEIPASSDAPTSSSPISYIMETDCRYYYDSDSSTVSPFCSSRTSISVSDLLANDDSKPTPTNELPFYDEFASELRDRLQKVAEEREQLLPDHLIEYFSRGNSMDRPSHRDDAYMRRFSLITNNMSINRKRPHSFCTLSDAQDALNSQEVDTTSSKGPNKKPRLTIPRRRSTRTVHSRNGFANKTAALRRRSTLQPNPDDDTEKAITLRDLTLPDLNTPTAPKLDAPPIASLPQPAVSAFKSYESPVTETESDWVPTRPCTPEATEQKDALKKDIYRDPRLILSPVKIVNSNSKVSAPVPVIAPPADHAWVPPLSEESQAKKRLQRLREREECLRRTDGLAVSMNQQDDLSSKDYVDRRNDRIEELRSGLQDKDMSYREGLGRDIVDWLLQVMPDYSSSEFNKQRGTRSSTPADTNASQSTGTSTTTSSTSTSQTNTTSSMYTGSQASSDWSEDKRERAAKTNLLDQLTNSPETRFHAVYMFLRFFNIILGQGDKGKNEQIELFSGAESGDVRDEEGFELVAWDVAVACLAMSVKMNRDVLPPLFPISSSMFEELAPHDIGFDELETAQRDVFAALSHNLGSTPQATLDELWIALPALRELVGFQEPDATSVATAVKKECACQGWSTVLEETWCILLDAVADPEILQFPLSLLSGAALVEGLVCSLVKKYQAEEPWHSGFVLRRNMNFSTRVVESRRDNFKKNQYTTGRTNASRKDKENANADVNAVTVHLDRSKLSGSVKDAWDVLTRRRVDKAKMEIEGVVEDVVDVLGVTRARFAECRKWIRERSTRASGTSFRV